MANYNRVTLLGNLTRDVELRHTQSGMAVGKFGLAVNHKRGDTEEVLFIDCTAFAKSAEILQQYAGKGSQLLVEGRLQLEQWEKDGQKRSKHSVVVDNFQFVGSRDDGDRAPRKSGGGRSKQPREDETGPAVGGGDFDDIPF